MSDETQGQKFKFESQYFRNQKTLKPGLFTVLGELPPGELPPVESPPPLNSLR